MDGDGVRRGARRLRRRDARARPPATTTQLPSSSAPAAVVTTAPRTKKPRTGLRIGGIVLAAAGVGLVGGGIGAAVQADSAVKDLNQLAQSGGTFDPAKDDAY